MQILQSGKPILASEWNKMVQMFPIMQMISDCGQNCSSVSAEAVIFIGDAHTRSGTFKAFSLPFLLRVFAQTGLLSMTFDDGWVQNSLPLSIL